MEYHGGVEHPFYPGSGFVEELGDGAGKGFNINVRVLRCDGVCCSVMECVAVLFHYVAGGGVWHWF